LRETPPFALLPGVSRPSLYPPRLPMHDPRRARKLVFVRISHPERAGMTSTRQPDESLSITAFTRGPGAVIDRVRMQARHVQLTRNGTPAVVLVPWAWWQAQTADNGPTADDIAAWHEHDETGAPDEYQDQDHAPADEPGPPGVAPTVADSLANSRCRDSGGTGPGLDPLPAHRPSTGGQP